MSDENNGDIGHNSENMTAAEKRALFFDHYRKIAAATDAWKLANDERKKLRKQAKADGLVLADIDYAFRCADVEDADLLVDELRRRAEIAAWMALPVDYQPELFGDVASDAEKMAYRRGSLARSLRKTPDPTIDGYETATPEGQAWLRGHADEGQPQPTGPSQAEIRAHTERELAQPIDEIDKPFAERHAAQKARDSAAFGGEPATYKVS